MTNFEQTSSRLDKALTDIYERQLSPFEFENARRVSVGMKPISEDEFKIQDEQYLNTVFDNVVNRAKRYNRNKRNPEKIKAFLIMLKEERKFTRAQREKKKVSLSDIYARMNLEPALLALPPHVCNKAPGYKKLFPKHKMIIWLGAFLWLFENKKDEPCPATNEDVNLFCDLLIEQKEYSQKLTHTEILHGFAMMYDALSDNMLDFLRGIDWDNEKGLPINIGVCYGLMKGLKSGELIYKRTKEGIMWGLKEWENDPSKMNKL